MKIKIKTKKIIDLYNLKRGQKLKCIKSHHPGINECMNDVFYKEGEIYTVIYTKEIAGYIFFKEVPFFTAKPKNFEYL